MTHVAPRIVNNVSCVKRINDECYFSWQAQYLVMLERHLCCSYVTSNDLRAIFCGRRSIW